MAFYETVFDFMKTFFGTEYVLTANGAWLAETLSVCISVGVLAFCFWGLFKLIKIVYGCFL